MARSDHPWFTPIHWKEAEQLEGRKLNRRLKYFKKSEEGKLETDNPWAFPQHHGAFTYGEWTEDCSGCTDTCDGYQNGPFGCSECGYTGKRRNGMHTPLIKELD